MQELKKQRDKLQQYQKKVRSSIFAVGGRVGNAVSSASTCVCLFMSSITYKTVPCFLAVANVPVSVLRLKYQHFAFVYGE